MITNRRILTSDDIPTYHHQTQSQNYDKAYVNLLLNNQIHGKEREEHLTNISKSIGSEKDQSE